MALCKIMLFFDPNGPNDPLMLFAVENTTVFWM